MVDILNSASDFINRLDFKEESIWWSKANFFSLKCEVAREPRIIAVGVEATRERLLSFASALPEDYALAAREAVGRKSQRGTQGQSNPFCNLGLNWNYSGTCIHLKRCPTRVLNLA